MSSLYIIDAVNYLFRSYYAIGPMTNPKGESTSALYGFIRSIQKIKRDFSPTHLVAVFDGPDSTIQRKEVYADYKMHRKGAPEDLYPQFEWAFQFCEMAGIPALCIPRVEADDTIASITVWAEKEFESVYLCTSDKDLCQLVSDKVFVLNVHKNNLRIDKAKVEEIYGVKPAQMLDLLAIMGDSSDNIPGLEGFGPKTAAALLQQFGTLDAILDNPDQVPGKKKQQTLLQQKDRAILSRKLATLHVEVQVPKRAEFYQLKPSDAKTLESFYRENKFITLLKELGPEPIPTATVEKSFLVPFDEKVSYQLIDDDDSFFSLIEKLLQEKEICIDTETTDKHPLVAELIGIGFCTSPATAWYIPLNGNLGAEKVLAGLQTLFSQKQIGFFGHNIKYDYHVLSNQGLRIANINFDTILASYLLSPQSRRHNLDQITLEVFRKHKISIKSLIGEGRKQISMKEVPIEKVTEYCGEDCDFTFRLKKFFENELKKRNLESILKDIELPLLPVLARMEEKGIFLDRAKLEQMSQALDAKLEKLEMEIHESVGEKFNIKSPKQLSRILYEQLGLKPPRSRKQTAYSTGAEVLEALAKEAPVVSKILEYRGLEKLLSTYVKALPEQINPKTQRIHCTFNQSVTATGRLSCQNPNLQNIPVRTTEGKKIREGFKPQYPDWSYLSADYSQIELRLLAHFSEEPELLKAFNSNQDIHIHTASLIFDIPIDQVTKEMRYRAKTVNFGILYGQGPFGLSQELGISVKEATAFIHTYFERYPKVRKYLDYCKEFVKKNGYAITLKGRQRPIPEIDSKNGIIRAAAERLAVNTPLQGTQADIIKLAMIAIDKEIKKNNLQGYMILQIHDELIFEVPDTESALFQVLVKEKMESVLKLKVPLLVDIEVGKNWGEC